MKSGVRSQRLIIFLPAFLVLFLGQVTTLGAAEPAVLEGMIFDIDEKPVASAEIYIFDSPDVKRPADFI